MKRSLKSDQFWLCASLISFGVFYLTFTWKTTKNIDSVITNSLFWGAIFLLLWRRRDRLIFDREIISSLSGLLLIALLIVKSLSLYSFESLLFIYLAPFIALFGITLIISGIKNIKQYWLELFFAGFLFIPPSFLGLWFNTSISTVTAKLSAYLLYYFGFNVTSQGIKVLLHLPNQGNFLAQVNYRCTGILMMGLMLKLALLLVSFVWMKWWQRVWFPFAALAIGFFLGVIRVSILTLAVPDPSLFDYWHGSEGTQIFSTLSIIIFFCFCYPVLKEPKPRDFFKKQDRVSNVPILTTNLETEKRENTQRAYRDN
jgi:cyanoexosortase A